MTTSTLLDADADRVRVGDWRGAGPVLAWRDKNDNYDHRYWPDQADVGDAIDDALDAIRQRIEPQINAQAKVIAARAQGLEGPIA